jgi:hypothetical protein
LRFHHLSEWNSVVVVNGKNERVYHFSNDWWG